MRSFLTKWAGPVTFCLVVAAWIVLVVVLFAKGNPDYSASWPHP